jgi:sialate O-acetylesterase
MTRFLPSFALAAAALTLSSVRADVKMIPLFGDHMVLQQETKVPVWGTADAGEKVTVKVGDHTASATTGADGSWRVELAPFPNGAPPTTMTVTGKNTLTFQDVLIGDVWVASGQSNMELSLASAESRETVIPAANDPQLRLFTVTKKLSMQPLADLQGQWAPCTPDVAKTFTAAGYFFGQELRTDLKRPIGIIGTYWGGSTAQAWTSLSGLQKDPPSDRYVTLYQKNLADFPKLNDGYDAKEAVYKDDLKKWTDAGNKPLYDAWIKLVRDAQKNHQPPPAASFPPMPKEPPLPGGDQKAPANLFNGMINPLLTYAIKGVIWYQGEYNADDPMEYYDLFPRLIRDWREKWGQGDFPFLFVQLPSLFVKNDPSFPRSIIPNGWDLIREAQFKTTALPHTGMAVTIDTGGRLHPPDKLDVGHRLALIGRHNVYGENIVCSGPIYQAMKVDGNAITLSFSQVNGGLTIGMSPDPDPNATRSLQPTDKLAGFVIAGADKAWVEADAKIVGSTVVVSSAQVSNPVAVRYGWGGGLFTAESNLYNKDGLPTAPFRTDDWDDVWPAKYKAMMAAKAAAANPGTTATPPTAPVPAPTKPPTTP